MKIVKDLKILHQVSTPVRNLSEGNKIGRELIKTLEGLNRAIGLSAIQIGIPKRVFVTFLNRKPEIFINPELDCWNDWEVISSKESCLSLPGVIKTVKRYNSIIVDRLGWSQGIKFKGLEAIIVQHEWDHLQGITIKDKDDFLDNTGFMSTSVLNDTKNN